MTDEIKAKYRIKLRSSWLPALSDYKMKLFSDSLPTIKKKILRSLKLNKEDPFSFIFSIQYLQNSFILNNEDDLYFFLSNHLQSKTEQPFILDIQQPKLTKKALLAKESLKNPDDKPSDPLYEGIEEVLCVFCKESSQNIELIDDLGLFYGPFKSKGKEFYVHEKCAIWTPDVYLDMNNRLKNLTKEIKRSKKMTCSYCKSNGAGLGCFVKNCKKNYHFKCSLDEELDCALDCKNFRIYCPEHKDLLPEELANTLTYETIFCKKCGSGDDDMKLILCEKCLNGYHIYCLEDKLEEVPEEDWFCMDCAEVGTVRICGNDVIDNF